MKRQIILAVALVAIANLGFAVGRYYFPETDKKEIAELKTKVNNLEYSLELNDDSRKDIFQTNGLIDPNTDDYDFKVLVAAENPNHIVVQTRFRLYSVQGIYKFQGTVNHRFPDILPTGVDMPLDEFESFAEELGAMNGVVGVGFNCQDIELVKTGDVTWDIPQIFSIVKKYLAKAVEPVTTGHPF